MNNFHVVSEDSVELTPVSLKAEFALADRRPVIAMAAHGSFLTCARNSEIEVRDGVTLELLHTLTGHTERITAIALSADGSVFASADDSTTVTVWDTATGVVLHTFTAPDTVFSLVVTSDKKLLIAGIPYGIVAWDLKTGEERYHRDVDSRHPIISLRHFNWGAEQPRYTIDRLSHYAQFSAWLETLYISPGEYTSEMRYPLNGDLMAYDARGKGCWDAAGIISLCMQTTPFRRRPYVVDLWRGGDWLAVWRGKIRPRAFVVSPNGAYAAVAEVGHLTVWSVSTGEQIAALVNTDWKPKVCLFTGDSRAVLFDSEGALYRWSFSSAAPDTVRSSSPQRDIHAFLDQLLKVAAAEYGTDLGFKLKHIRPRLVARGVEIPSPVGLDYRMRRGIAHGYLRKEDRTYYVTPLGKHIAESDRIDFSEAENGDPGLQLTD